MPGCSSLVLDIRNSPSGGGERAPDNCETTASTQDQHGQRQDEARAAPPLIRPCQVARKARLGAVGDESQTRVPYSGRSRRVPRTGTQKHTE
ncbi:hypothetical protein HPB50_005519 [Hyalomma asiaticum]|uniref:Uncharacterized protein n=1 Tax=Hyalomma asiaticum TaxID=266040 RepID=A0ACB7TBD2_HYAAI|nr:hypothetical protein HPB50_005519 [Hyalomma asiaticum]